MFYFQTKNLHYYYFFLQLVEHRAINAPFPCPYLQQCSLSLKSFELMQIPIGIVLYTSFSFCNGQFYVLPEYWPFLLQHPVYSHHVSTPIFKCFWSRFQHDWKLYPVRSRFDKNKCVALMSKMISIALENNSKIRIQNIRSRYR